MLSITQFTYCSVKLSQVLYLPERKCKSFLISLKNAFSAVLAPSVILSFFLAYTKEVLQLVRNLLV